jgi:hypothetical protein
MNDEYYIRMNTEGAVEIRTAIEIPQLNFMSCEDFVTDALESIPKFLADNEVALYNSHMSIEDCPTCLGIGSVASEDDVLPSFYTDKDDVRVGWTLTSYTSTVCPSCAGTGCSNI